MNYIAHYYLIVIFLILIETYICSNNIQWLAKNGTFDNPANWAGNLIPQQGDNAIIDNGGICNIVTLDVNLLNLYLFSKSIVRLSTDIYVSQSLKIQSGSTFTSISGLFNVEVLEILGSNSHLDVQLKQGSIMPNHFDNYGKVLFRGSGVETTSFPDIDSFGGSTITFLKISSVKFGGSPRFYSGSTLFINSSSVSMNISPIIDSGSLISIDNGDLAVSSNINGNIILYKSTLFLPKMNSTLNSNISFTESIFRPFISLLFNTSTISLKSSSIIGTIYFFNSTVLEINQGSLLGGFNGYFFDNSKMIITKSDITSPLTTTIEFKNLSSLFVSQTSTFTVENIYFYGQSKFSMEDSNLKIKNKFLASEQTRVTFLNITSEVTSIFVSIARLFTDNSRISSYSTQFIEITEYTGTGGSFLVDGSLVFNSTNIHFKNNLSSTFKNSTTTTTYSLVLESSSLNLLQSSSTIGLLVVDNSKLVVDNCSCWIQTLTVVNSSCSFISTSLSYSNIDTTKSNYSSFIFKDTVFLNGNGIIFNSAILVLDNITLTKFMNISLTDTNATIVKSQLITVDQLQLVKSIILFNQSNIFTTNLLTITNSTVCITQTIFTITYPTKLQLSSFNLSLENQSTLSANRLDIDSQSQLNILDSHLVASIENNGLINLKSATIQGSIINNGYIVSENTFTINGLLELSNTSTVQMPISSISTPIIQVSGNISIQGSLVGIINKEVLNTNSTIKFPVINSVYLDGNFNNILLYSLDKINGYLETPIQGVCKIFHEVNDQLYTLLISECDLANSTTNSSPCINQCGGENNGKCTFFGCKCNDPWVGPDCTSKQITGNVEHQEDTNSPISTISFSSGVQNVQSTISILQIRELDFKENIEQTYNINQWKFLGQNQNKQLIYTTTITKPNQPLSTDILIKVEWFSTDTKTTFAGERYNISPSTLKYNIEIGKYPFSSLSNKLQLILSTKVNLTTDEDEICSKQDFQDLPLSDNNFQYLKIQMNSHSLYGRFINRAYMDGRNIKISNSVINASITNNNEANIAMTIPSYNQKSILDTDFSLLFDSRQAKSKPNTICKINIKEGVLSSKPPSLSKPQLSGVVIGGVCFIFVLIISLTYIYRKKKQRQFLQKQYALLENTQIN